MFINFSCRKTEIHPTVRTVFNTDSSAVSQRFFNSDLPNDQSIIGIRNNILRQEKQKPFVSRYSSFAGFPVWDKAVFSRRSGVGRREGTESVIFIPLAKDSIVNAILRVTIADNDTTFQTIYRWQYN